MSAGRLVEGGDSQEHTGNTADCPKGGDNAFETWDSTSSPSHDGITEPELTHLP